MATASEIKVFIEKLGRLAVLESKRRISAGKGYVLPSVCIAQSALETGYGTSGLMTRANAFFGIKAGGSWTGAVYRADTWEVDSAGSSYNTTANFRAYSTIADSVTDYYDLIGNNSRYSNALSYSGKPKSPRECITAIWSGGYATDTLYVEKVMNIINARNLTQYDALIGSTEITDETVPDVTMIFKKSDLVNGRLNITDSGRSIANDTSVPTAVALDWNKAPTIQQTGVYTIKGLYSIQRIFFAELVGDTATIGGELMEGQTVSFQKGAKIGFFITYNDGGLLNLDLVQNSFELTLQNNFYPNSDESYASGIAIFVKVTH